MSIAADIDFAGWVLAHLGSIWALAQETEGLWEKWMALIATYHEKKSAIDPVSPDAPTQIKQVNSDAYADATALLQQYGWHE